MCNTKDRKRGIEKTDEIMKPNRQMADLNPNIYILTLNVSGLNISIKSQKLSSMKKEEPKPTYLVSARDIL